MSLPILKVTSAPTTETLIRYFHQTETKLSEHFSQPTLLDFGTAWTNPELSRVHNANRMLGVALTGEITPADAMRIADEHFAAAGTRCFSWIMNPSAPPEQTAPMAEHLQANGFAARSSDIMYLERIPAMLPAGTRDSLQIIPARASFKHVRVLQDEDAKSWNEPQVAEAAMTHLDDPHYDALVAIQNSVATAYVGVLAMGEVGLIEQVFVSESFRRRGIGTTMVGRAIEICARSLFKHILLGVFPTNTVAIRLYEKFGFRKIGTIVDYHRT